MVYLNHMENVVIKKRKKLNVKNLCLLIFFLVMLIVFLFSLIKVIMWIIDNNNTNDIIKKVADTYEINEKSYDNEVIINENEKDIYFDYMKLKFIDVDINKLKTFNPDTIGFIKVMGTNINYPFVQTLDNDYYLNRSYDKTYNNAGWIFLDYRNNEFNDKNTIIYGHGRINGTMFGSLKDTLKSSWQNNKDNYIIKISTEKENSIWQIFSVYKIATTSDYLETFFSDNEFESFINLIKGRSSYNFETNVTNEDKVLTLSTCYNDNDKMVVHAKLIKYVQK